MARQRGQLRVDVVQARQLKVGGGEFGAQTPQALVELGELCPRAFPQLRRRGERRHRLAGPDDGPLRRPDRIECQQAQLLRELRAGRRQRFVFAQQHEVVEKERQVCLWALGEEVENGDVGAVDFFRETCERNEKPLKAARR